MNATADLALVQSNSKLPIERRIVRFDYSDIDEACFYGDNIVTSAYFTALSSTFPAGEAEFIRSVRLFENKIKDQKLAAEVKDFAAQEAHHSLQHKKLNKRLLDAGFKVNEVEKLIQDKLAEREAGWSPEKRLRRTVSAEHFTATMAHYALTHPEHLDPTPSAFKYLMLWHAIEEVEHKSVAFDVYKETVGKMRSLRWHYAYFAFIEFPLNMWMITRYLLKSGGHKVTWNDRWEFLKSLFGKNGMQSSMAKHYFMFLKKDFHPWDIDDSELVAQWKEELSPYFVESDKHDEPQSAA